jgi:hypothetical protein
MSFDPQIQNQNLFSTSPLPQQPRKKSGWRWLIGLLLVGVGCMFFAGVLCLVGVWYVASNLDKWVVGLGREAVVSMVNESELHATEKTEVITQVDRIVTAYKEGKINQADLERVFTGLQDSPALKALVLYNIENEYLSDSKLPAEELAQGRLTFQRALRGIYEGKITEDQFYAVLPEDGEEIRPVSTNADENDADDQLRETLVKLKVMADNARIPNEPFQLDISDELQKYVDEALVGK